MHSRYRHSVRFKLALSLVVPLTIVCFISSCFRYLSYRQDLLDILDATCAHIGEIAGRTLGDVESPIAGVSQKAFASFARQQPASAFYLFAGDRLLFYAPGGEAGDASATSAGLSAANADAMAWGSLAKTGVMTLPSGRIIYRTSKLLNSENSIPSNMGPGDRALCLVCDFPMDTIQVRLAAYRRSRLVLFLGSIMFIFLIGDLAIRRVVVNRLEGLLATIEGISSGAFGAQVPVRWQDEIAELGHALNHMSLGLAEKERLEQHVKQSSQRLQAQAEHLALLDGLAGAVSQTLDLRQVLQIALSEVVHLLGLRGGWIHLRSDGSRLDSIVSFGLKEEVASKVHVHCAWHQALRSDMLATTASQPFSSPTFLCPVSTGTPTYDARCIYLDHLVSEGLGPAICIPIEFKGEILGIMTLLGDVGSCPTIQFDDSDDLFIAIGRQLGIAVENARLYEQLCAKEALQKRLLERLIFVQEQERQRIARELHDQTSQSLASLIVTLKILAQASSLEQVREQVKQLQDVVADVLTKVHDIATRLRPQALDDLGLVPALRQYIKDFRDRFQLLVDLQVVGFGDQRLGPEAETSLYRIAQEALTNVAVHAQASAASVLLENRGHSLVLIVEDDGVGFDVDRVMSRGPHGKALGLHGMEERASLVGGTLTIESAPGKGTTLYVVLPIGKDGHDTKTDTCPSS